MAKKFDINETLNALGEIVDIGDYPEQFKDEDDIIRGVMSEMEEEMGFKFLKGCGFIRYGLGGWMALNKNRKRLSFVFFEAKKGELPDVKHETVMELFGLVWPIVEDKACKKAAKRGYEHAEVVKAMIKYCDDGEGCKVAAKISGRDITEEENEGSEE